MTPHAPTRPSRLFALWAALTMGLAIALLTGAAFIGLRSISNSNSEVQDAAKGLAAYRTMQQVVAREALREASYRRAPSPTTRLALLGALDAGADPIRDVDGVGELRDVQAIKTLLVLNADYAREIRSQLVVEGIDPQTLPDDLVAGPALNTMQQLINDGLSRLSNHSTEVLQEQQRLTRRLERLVPVVLVGTALLLTLAWSLLVRQHRKAQQRAERNEFLAHRDELTGLPNRRAFEAELARELAGSHHDCGLILMDLDDFKQINDTCGHDVGDDVLRIVASRLSSVVRASDMVARLGGDEFVFLVRPWDQVALVQERLKAATSEPLHVQNHLLHPSASVGAARLVPGVAQDELLREADRLMYSAKAAAKPRGQRLRGLPPSG